MCIVGYIFDKSTHPGGHLHNQDEKQFLHPEVPSIFDSTQSSLHQGQLSHSNLRMQVEDKEEKNGGKKGRTLLGEWAPLFWECFGMS